MTFSDPLLPGADAELGQSLAPQCCIVDGQHQMPVRGELTSRFPTGACTKQPLNRDYSVSNLWVWFFQTQISLHWSFSALWVCAILKVTRMAWSGRRQIERNQQGGTRRQDQGVGPGGGARDEPRGGTQGAGLGSETRGRNQGELQPRDVADGGSASFFI